MVPASLPIPSADPDMGPMLSVASVPLMNQGCAVILPPWQP